METAKVDIRKLQLLNDRINQCIDALNQVRLSVHGLAAGPGLSHSPQGIFGSTSPGTPYGFGAGQLPFAPQQFAPQQGVGLSHTAGIGNPFGVAGNPFGVAGISGLNPQFGPFGQIPMVSSPYFQQGMAGLSHTPGPWAQGTGFTPGISPYSGVGYNEGLQDPLLTARISQTFPYAQFPVPPVVSLY